MQVHSDAVRRHLSIPRPTLPPCGVRGQREGSSTVQRRGKRSRRERGGVGGGLGVEWGGSCPFCGGDNIDIFETDFGRSEEPYQFAVKCKSCGALVSAEDKDNAIAAWNRRAK